MKLVHFADVHLGHRAFQGGAPGKNAREGDVARAFERAIGEAIALAPKLVLIAGDVFDRPDPPHSAMVTLARGLECLRNAIPGVHVCLVAGSRDTPSEADDPGALAAVDTLPAVDAVTSEVRSVRVDDVNVVMVPHRAALSDPELELLPDPDARRNILLAFGRVARSGADGIPVREEDWDYIALGFEHAWRQVRPRAFYAGSLEKVGPAPWSEVGVEKGFLHYDLEERSSTFHPIPGRPVVSLAPIRFEAERPTRLQERLKEVLEEVPDGIDGKIVRLRIQGLPSGALHLVQEVVPDYRKRALHLEVQLEAGSELEPGRHSLAGRVARRLEGGDADLGDLTKVVEETLGDPHVVAGGKT
jgi:DNA repair exonuclease SbcCD nuclease subunit